MFLSTENKVADGYDPVQRRLGSKGWAPGSTEADIPVPSCLSLGSFDFKNCQSGLKITSNI